MNTFKEIKENLLVALIMSTIISFFLIIAITFYNVVIIRDPNLEYNVIVIVPPVGIIIFMIFFILSTFDKDGV